MSVDYFSNGPSHIYVQFFNNNALQTVRGLGITTGGVRSRREPLWRPSPSDGAGESQVEATFQGMSYVVSFSMGVHDPVVLELAQLPLPNFSLVPGKIPTGAIGAFFRKQKNYFRLMIYRPYAVAQGQEPIINLPMTRLGSSDLVEGIEETRINMTWIGHTNLQYCAGGNGDYFNYDGSGWPGAIACPA